MQQPIKYFVSGHTARGYVNYLLSNIADTNKVIVLQNGDYRDVSELMSRLIKESDDTSPEIMYIPEGAQLIGGILLQHNELAVIHESIVPHPLKNVENINLAHYYETLPNKQNTKDIQSIYEESYALFKKGLDIHDQLEKVYVREMNFKKADDLAEEFIEALLLHVKKKSQKRKEKKRLFGTNTLDGMVNMVPELLQPIGKKVYIKGRAGTGKSVFMKKVWRACEDYGLDVEVYHCSFDPNSIDMIVVRELDFCMFDSTSPHEFFPTSNDDQVIDLYEKTVKPGTDERHAVEIERLTKLYKQEMKAGLERLREIKQHHNRHTGKLDIDALIQAVNRKR